MAYDIAGMMDNVRNSYKQSRLGTLAKLAYAEPDKRQASLAEMYGIDPNSANTMRKEFDEQEKADLANFSRTFLAIAPKDENAAGAMYQNGVQRFGAKFRAMGIEPPKDWKQALPFFEQAAGVGSEQMPADIRTNEYYLNRLGYDKGSEQEKAFLRMRAGQDPRAVPYGFKYDAFGKAFVEDKNRGVLAPATMGQGGQPAGGVQAQDPMAGGLAFIAQEGERMRAAGRPVAEINEWKDQAFEQLRANTQLGVIEQAPPQNGGQARIGVKPDKADTPAAPSGYRFNPDGSLAPIPGGPADPANKLKPATQKQAQSDAVKLYAQLPALKRRIQRVADASGNLGMFGLDGGPIDQFALRYTEGGSELESSVGQLRATLLPFVRVPGVGSQSDLEARLDGLQYPDVSQPPAVRKKNIDELNAFIRDLESALSAVTKQGSAPTEQNQPVRVQSADDYNRLPSGARYIDPNGNLRVKK